MYAVFTDPTDRVISVSGGAPGGPDLEFAVIGPGSLYRECTGGLCETFDANERLSFAFEIVAGPYHSFLCIRGGSQLSDFPAFGDDVSSPGLSRRVFSPDVVFAPQILKSPFRAILGPRTVFGGYLTNNPASGLHEGQLVLIGQFTLPEDDEFTLQGVVDYTLVDPVNPSGTCWLTNPFSVSSSDFSGLSDCSSFEDFFTSFTQAVADDPSQEWDLCEDGIFDLCQGLRLLKISAHDPK